MLLSQNIHIRATLRRYIYSVREMLRTGGLLLGNHIRVTLRTNTRCGKSNIPHTPTGNKWFSESISGLLGQPVPTSTVYPIPVRAPSCSRIISGLLYEQIPAAGNQSSQTHNASLSQNIHIRLALRRYILSEGNTPCGCPAARESYPGYSTNKYPLREIKHPAHPHTALNKTHHPPLNTLYN
jgi:hypothetical protein